MQINPFNIPLAEKEAAHQASLGRIESLNHQLTWYGNFEVEERHRQLAAFDRMLAASKPRRDALDAQLGQLRREQEAVDELAQLRLDPRSWVSSERSVAKRKSLELTGRIAELSQQLSALNAPKTDDGVDVLLAERLRIDLDAYRGFDELAARGELAIRQLEQRVLDAELTDLRARKLALDGELAAPCQALEACRAKVNALKRDIRKAEELGAALGRTHGAGRREIHERCKSEFGDSSPGRVIQQKERQLEPLKRDIAKLEKRIEEAVRNAQLDVREVIIDGSNMTYHGDEFIGLRALEALVPILAERVAVTINFDPGFGRRVGMSSKDIRAQLPGARVHFVPRGMSADPFVLSFVEGNPHAYVISNDTFRDHGEKEAVRSKRILRHAILNDRVSIPALGLVTRFA